MGRKTAAALLAASAVLVAACGDDGGTETGGEDVEEPGAPEDTGADDDGEAAGNGGGDFCDEYARFSQDWGISDIHEDPAGYEAALGELEAVPEIAEDVQTLVNNIEVIIAMLGATAEGTGHGSEAHDDLRDAMGEQELQQTIQEVMGAHDAIDGWVEDNCAT